MKEPITNAMKEEHNRIDIILDEFKSSLKNNSKDIQENWDRLEWNIKKHFFTEEKVIFSTFTLEGREDKNQDLLKEHEEIIEIIKDINEKKLNGIEEELTKLENKLKEHSEFENETFYPELDKTLTEEEKKNVIERAKEIIRG